MKWAIRVTRNYPTQHALVEKFVVNDDVLPNYTPIEGGSIDIRVLDNERDAAWTVEWWVKESGWDVEYVEPDEYEHPEYLQMIKEVSGVY
jgi:hypothetical protein